MEPEKLFGIVLKKLWIVICLPVLFGLITMLASFYLLKPVYESSIMLYVIHRTPDRQMPIAFDDILVSQNLVKDYREIIKSRSVTQKVVDELSMADLTSDRLAKRIQINLKSDTRIIEIGVQDKNPDTARKLADKVGDVFVRKIEELMQAQNVSVVDQAEVPDEPVHPKPVLYTALAFFAGLLTALGIVLVLEYTDHTIKTREDVEQYLGLTVLGSIPLLTLK